MHKFLFLTLLLAAFIGQTCAGQKSFPKVYKLLILPPLTEIKVIRTGNKLVTDSSLTRQVQKEIFSNAKNLVPENINTEVLDFNEMQSKEINEAMISLVRTAEKILKPKVIKVPEPLLLLLDSLNQDFALGIIDVGFIRTDENQSREYTKSMGFNFFSLGIYNFVPIKSFSTMRCFVIDRKQKAVRFYEKSMWQERDPTETIVIKSQLHHLLMSYFLRMN